MRTLLTAASTISLCGAARRRLNRPERKEAAFCRGRVRLTGLWNRGAAFGLPIPRKALLASSGLCLLSALAHRKAAPLSTGLILGGGLSNLAERLSRGAVYDYVQFPSAPGKLNKFVFNLADFAVFAGILGLLLPRRKK